MDLRSLYDVCARGPQNQCQVGQVEKIKGR